MMKTKTSNLLLRSDPTFGMSFQTAPGAEPKKVDREKGIIPGYAVATRGLTKDRRGEFDQVALEALVSFGNAKSRGIKSRFTHPGMCEDGFGKFLGRSKNFRLDGDVVRADLFLSETAKKTPGENNLWDYVCDMAEQEPDMFGASCVIGWKPEYKRNAKGQELRDSEGNLLPPLIRIYEFRASDLVDDPAANDGLFSREADLQLVGAFSMLDRFADLPRAEVESKLTAVLDRYYTTRGTDMTTQAPTKKPVAEMSLAELQAEHALAAAELAQFKAGKLTEAANVKPENKTEEPKGEETKTAPAKVAPKAEEFAAGTPTALELERDRVGQILALGKAFNLTQFAAELVTKPEVSIDKAREQFLVQLGKSMPVVGASGAPSSETPATPEAKFGAEYDAQKHIHDEFGVTKEQYIKSRIKSAKPA